MTPAPTYEEEWWRYPGKTRVRCSVCGKVAFRDERHARDHAERILKHGGPRMKVYQGKRCEHWHLSRDKRAAREAVQAARSLASRLRWGGWTRLIDEEDR